jgi:2'-5' RNA ligase
MTGRESMIRAFIAIELPREVKEFLGNVASGFRSMDRGVRWVRTESIHLTLKFLGEIAPETIDRVREVGRTVFHHAAPFQVEIRGIGVFPGLNRPRVIWAGVREPTGRLAGLAGELEAALEPLGFKRETRPFNPHLTLGRVKGRGISDELRSAIRDDMDREGPSFAADHAVLFRSTLKRTGAEYSPLDEFDFPRR